MANRANDELTYVRKRYNINKQNYLWCCAGFDIETSTHYEVVTTKKGKEKVSSHFSMMYIAMFSIDEKVYHFRTWKEVIEFFLEYPSMIGLREDEKTVVFIHNESFEMQFMRKELDRYDLIESIFAKEERKPLKIELKNGIVFLDSMTITNTSLDGLAKTYCNKYKKLKGDLDYSIWRDSEFELTYENGLRYCDNDVLILSEFSNFYAKEYLEQGFMPMTSTGVVRHKLKEMYNEWLEEKKENGETYTREWVRKDDKNHRKNKKTVIIGQDEIYKAYPDNYPFYDLLMNKLFAGGYTHACAWNITEGSDYISDVDSYDETSAYPYMMLAKYYPISKFVKCSLVTNIQPLLETNCCIFTLRIKNVKSKYGVTTISKSKCIDYENIVEDNGKIFKADSLTMVVNEIDFDVIKRFYDFDNEFEWCDLYVAKRGKLPIYIRRMVCYYYQLKQELKFATDGETEEEKIERERQYKLAKARLNSIYGMMVQKLNLEEIVYNGQWNKQELDSEEILKKERRKAISLPQFGVWVTSHARWCLLSNVEKICQLDDGKGYMRYCYSDTDSIKVKRSKEVQNIFDEYNNNVIEHNKEWIKEMNVPFDLFYELGTFDKETSGNQVYRKFKTLGAKRYIYEQLNEKTGDYEWRCTIAGLPKKSLVEYCNETKKNILEVFNDGMEIPKEYSHKLCSYYMDEPQSFEKDGKYYESLSYVSLIPTEFTLGMSDLLEFVSALKGECYYDTTIY